MTATIDELLTIRDWLRFAVSRFTAAGVAYGHGTSTALDEAAFIVLEGLRLPVDQLEPWLDARLTRPERRRLASLIEARITTRRPAPYLVNAAYIRGRRFYVDERVIVPRSYLGELMCDQIDGESELPAFAIEPESVSRVLDLCTGSGCLAILAAMAFPQAEVDAVDISEGALAVATRNVADYGLEDRIRLVRSDLFAALAGCTYDLILSNPPYVTEAAVTAFPPEHAAEPRIAHLGGADGLDIVRRILADAPAHLPADGMLVVEIGTGRPLLEAERPELPFLWLDTAESEGEVFAIAAADLAGGRQRRPRKPRSG